MTAIERSDKAYRLHCEALELRGAGKFEEASDRWAECVQLVRDEPVYLREYADCLARLRRWEEDLRYAGLAAAMEPTCAESWLLMGAACGHLGRQAEAKRYYDRANALAPNSVAVRFNLSLWELLHGDYERGWKDYAWRLMHAGQMRTLKPEWDGSPMPGRVLYVWSEQGLGDSIQFVRFVPRAREVSGAYVVLEPHRELLELFHDLGVADEVRLRPVGGGLGFEDFEHVSLMSLPRVLGINDESEFWTGGYVPSPRLRHPSPIGMGEGLVAGGCARRGSDGSVGLDRSGEGPPSSGTSSNECDRVEAMLLKAEAWHGYLRVGYCFRGRKENPNDGARSLGDEDGRRVLEAIEGIGAEAVSLMPSDEYLTTFAETIEVVGGLDLVITVDTAVAHLAGAMGKPVWLMIHYAPDWRWCVNHETSTPWYPSARLFRQASYGDWACVVKSVTDGLAEWAGWGI